MLGPEEKSDGSIKVHFTDNTYKTVSLKIDTPAAEVVEWLCKRVSVAGRVVQPARHELSILSPGSQAALREQRLEPDDKPLQVQQELGGAAGIKFVFRECRVVSPSPISGIGHCPPEVQVAGEDGSASDEAAQVVGQDASNNAGASAEQQVSSPGPASAELGSAHVVADPVMAAYDESPAPPGAVADSGSRTRKGTLERLIDGGAWYSCMAILAEDRFWYSQAPSSQGGCVGGGMASVRLQDCDKVLEGEDKRHLFLFTKGDKLTFRCKSAKEREAWLLGITGQTALVKEKGILMQAEQIIATMELRKASLHMTSLESFSNIQGVLGGPQQSRRLFVDFVRSEHTEVRIGGGVQWPEAVSLDQILACVDRYPSGAIAATTTTDEGKQAASHAGMLSESDKDAVVWAFMEEVLFVRFQEHPVVQKRLCRIAAGLP